MRITFCGAARTVTGSCYLIEAAGHKILIDCGMFQGNKETRERNRSSFLFKPNEIEAVLLTHAHIDHSGLLPRLARDGFKGRIVATGATADLATVMLPDSAHIQEMEAEWRTRKGNRAGRAAVEPLYTMADAQAALALFAEVKYGEELPLFPEIRVRFLDAGHILGSAIIELWVREDGKETKIVFSGDLGQRNAPIINDPSVIDRADYLLIESTYGDRLHEDIKDRGKELAKVIAAAVASGGNLIIPSFAVERTQELLYEISQLYKDGASPKLPVYIDSPMAVMATEVFKRHPDYYDAETATLVASGASPFDFPGLHFVRAAEESKALNNLGGGAIIISANGMCEAGRILHHLKHNLWRPEAHLLFVGYQAEGTLGRRLLEGEKNVRVMGEDITVCATIHNIGSFSAHADQRGLLEWLGAMQEKPKNLFLVHGEDAVLAQWAPLAQQAVGAAPVVPYYGDIYTLADKAIFVGNAVQPAPQPVVQSAPVDDWAELLHKFEAAYQKLKSRLPSQAPTNRTLGDRLRALIRRIIEEMEKTV